MSEQGHFASPGYPNAYAQNAECVWTLGDFQNWAIFISVFKN